MSLRIYSWEGKVSNEPESEELPVKIIDISLREMGGNIGKVQVSCFLKPLPQPQKVFYFVLAKCFATFKERARQF